MDLEYIQYTYLKKNRKNSYRSLEEEGVKAELDTTFHIDS